MKNEMPEASHFCILGKYVSYKTEWMRCKKPPRKKSTKLLETMEIHHILLYNVLEVLNTIQQKHWFIQLYKPFHRKNQLGSPEKGAWRVSVYALSGHPPRKQARRAWDMELLLRMETLISIGSLYLAGSLFRRSKYRKYGHV